MRYRTARAHNDSEHFQVSPWTFLCFDSTVSFANSRISHGRVCTVRARAEIESGLHFSPALVLPKIPGWRFYKSERPANTSHELCNHWSLTSATKTEYLLFWRFCAPYLKEQRFWNFGLSRISSFQGLTSKVNLSFHRKLSSVKFGFRRWLKIVC